MNNPYRELSQVNPQRDNGHRRINNDIWAALIQADMPGSVFRILMYVIDRSWGYDKLEVALGYSQICKATNLSRPAVITAVKLAEEKHVLIIDHGSPQGMKTNTYLFNKYYDTWLTSKECLTSKVDDTRTSKVEHHLTSKVPTPEVSFPIENNRKQKRNIYQDNKKNKTGVNLDGIDPIHEETKKRYTGGKYGHLVRH